MKLGSIHTSSGLGLYRTKIDRSKADDREKRTQAVVEIDPSEEADAYVAGFRLRRSHFLFGSLQRRAGQGLLKALSSAEKPGYVLAELNELLTRLTTSEFKLAVSEPPQAQLDPYWSNYVAATIERAAASKRTEAPSWTANVQPLEEPVFGSSLKSLRLHLLTQSPVAFRSRNIFIDSSIGDRV